MLLLLWQRSHDRADYSRWGSTLKGKEVTIMNLKEYDVVALTEEIQATHKETQQPILLRHGQVGTILMALIISHI